MSLRPTNGRYMAEVIHRHGPRRDFQAVNNLRLLELIVNTPPAEAEPQCYDQDRGDRGRLNQTKRPPPNPARITSRPPTALEPDRSRFPDKASGGSDLNPCMPIVPYALSQTVR